MKKLLLLFILIVGCSKDDSPDIDSGCECQTLVFKEAIFPDQDYTTTDCLAYWEGPGIVNVTINKSVSPVEITGPTKEQVDIGKSKAGRCN